MLANEAYRLLFLSCETLKNLGNTDVLKKSCITIVTREMGLKQYVSNATALLICCGSAC
jgi:hypothetical protein